MDAARFEFSWDATKVASNLRKHGVSFDLAATVFGDPFMNTVPDPRHSEHEERFLTLGHAIGGTIVVVVHTFTEVGLIASVRIISARKATKHEIAVLQGNHI